MGWTDCNINTDGTAYIVWNEGQGDKFIYTAPLDATNADAVTAFIQDANTAQQADMQARVVLSSLAQGVLEKAVAGC